ncbi:hypothetical protein [Methyloversatilis sp.]|uniref:hypothetical protein n=1 Tax=Methyloversatilis sp. TaxID=2569862 RepID=UPI0027373746|nr:hypothetical protein [Methyloversatilis sp.]MDP3454543.1 hypothetical protein [Methyloversatilis sp.]MDP3579160.1 hypothetical protein [Methyloversatilis sp.]
MQVMSRFSRFLITILLVIALPLQGGVAAAMMCCVPGQPPAMAGGHDSATEAPLLSEHCAESAARDESAVQSPQSCASSAACCIAGALTPATLPAFADKAFHERPFADLGGPPSFIADSAEHPPRSASV